MRGKKEKKKERSQRGREEGRRGRERKVRDGGKEKRKEELNFQKDEEKRKKSQTLSLLLPMTFPASESPSLTTEPFILIHHIMKSAINSFYLKYYANSFSEKLWL